MINEERIGQLLEFSRTLKVMYAEDNEEARSSTAGMLQNFFDDIVLVTDGQEGVETFTASPEVFDLIISDINMPRMNGIEMIAAIREQSREIPILILSAYNESGYFIDTIRLGIEGYLLKPIELEQFVETVQKAVEKIYLKRENETYRKNLETKVQLRSLELEHAYYHDPLTGLQNRNALLGNIEEPDIVGLTLFDLENFSAINDIYGARIGDRILVGVANILVQMAGERHSIHRLSGDQFAFLTHEGCSREQTIERTRAVLDRISQKAIRAEVGGFEVDINVAAMASIVYGEPRERLLEYADMTLGYAKKSHQDLVVYSEALGLEKRYKADLEAVQMIKEALQQDRLVPYFQPIVKRNEISYECLVRVRMEDRVIAPAEFLDAIKRTKYYSEVTRTMIQKSIDVFRDRTESFSLNLSFEDISNEATIVFIKTQLKENQIAERLIFEILETESIDNFDTVRNFIREMKQLGVRIAIDDFGSGYSNFTYLLELKPDYIKIDGSLIRHIDTNENSYILSKSIVNFSKEMGIRVIAEYVHSNPVFVRVKELGVHGCQGYYLGEPASELPAVAPELRL